MPVKINQGVFLSQPLSHSHVRNCENEIESSVGLGFKRAEKRLKTLLHRRIHRSMKLWKAIKTFNVASLDESGLNGQDEAFQTCMAFLKGVEKSKTQNKKHGSYGLKHLVEN